MMIQFGLKLIIVYLLSVLTVQDEDVLTITVCSDIKSDTYDKCVNLRQALELLTSCYRSSSCSSLENQSFTICSLTCCNSTCYHHVNVIFEPGYHVLNEKFKITDLGYIIFSTIDNKPATITCNKIYKNDNSNYGIAFIKVNNLTIEYLNIIGCGMKHVSTSQFKVGEFVMFKSALLIQNSTDVTIKHANISESNGIGLSIVDTNGTVNIIDSVFSNNKIPSSEKNINATGGGGVYIEFTKCSPGVTNCNTADNLYNKNSVYNIVNCKIVQNDATYNLQSNGSYNFTTGTYVTFGDGGGLVVWLFGEADNNSIQITSTNFTFNVANNGGGLAINSRQNASHNWICITECVFVENTAAVFGGGGALVGFGIYHINEKNMYNTFILSNSWFEQNEAVGGTAGGIGWYGSNEPNVLQPTNHFRAYNTSFIHNFAQFGFAMEIHKGFLHFLVNGRMLDLIIDSCSFIENGMRSVPQLTLAVQNNSVGAVAASEVGIQIRGHTKFVQNRFTALVADKEKVEFCENSVTVFQNNDGVHGGAMLLIGTAWIMVNYNSTVTFVGNIAVVDGAAIYVQLITPYDHMLSHSCFIRYFEQNIAVSKWNASFTFISDTNDFACGRKVYQIYATTLHPCKSLYSNKFLDGNPFCFCSSIAPGKCEFDNVSRDCCLECSHHINHVATSPAEFLSFSVGGNIHVIPGKVDDLSVYLVDEVGNNDTDDRFTATCISEQSGTFLTHTSNCSSALSLPYVLSPYQLTNGLIQIAGKSGMTCHLQLQTITDFPITTILEVVLVPCPPGFVFNDYNAQCECIVSLTNQNLAIIGCEMKSFQAYFDRSYWIGYESNSTEHLVTSACPYRYCYQQCSSDQLLPGVADRQVLDKFVCGNTSRTGLLCGQCIDGYSVALNSPAFACQKCKGSYYLGILYLILSYIIPVTILFYVIMAYDLRMTTGPIGAFLFFSQIVGSQYHYALVYSINANTATTVAISNVLLAFYSISNLNFFNHGIFSYCLFKGAGTIDIIAFELLLSFYPVLLITVYFLVRKYCSRFRCFNRWRFSSNAISHGISAFLIFCFAKISLLAFALLIPAELRHVDGTGFETVVYLQGNLKYFQEMSHNIYAIASLFTIIVVITVPTLILLFHPIMMQVADYFKKGESRVVLLVNKCLLINKLKPILDSFQGDYKGNFRCFAGLQIFLYRILFFLIAVVATPNVSLSLLLLIGFFVIITLVHILALPFKRHLDNAIYSMIYILMLAIFVIEMYTESADTFLHAIVWLQLILLAIPLCCFVVYYTWKLSLTALRYFRPKAEEKSEDTNQLLSILQRSTLDDGDDDSD